MAKDLCFPFEEYCAVTLGYNVMYQGIRHAGLDYSTHDLRAAGLKNIYAPTDGTVTRAGRNASGFYYCLYSPLLNITFEFWHTDGTVVKAEGSQVRKGDVIGYIGVSGPYAEHTHFQINKGNNVWGSWNANVTDPNSYVARMELHKILFAPYMPMNLQPGTIVQVITTIPLNVRKTPTVTAPIIRKLQPNDKDTITTSNPQYTIADGYEWSPVNGGFIAVQVVSPITPYVKVISTDPCYPIKVENELLKLQVKTLQDSNAQLQSQIDAMQKKCDAVKAIICQ